MSRLEADDLADGAGFNVSSTATYTETASAASEVKYDLLGEIAEKTQLTRRTVRSDPRQGHAGDVRQVPAEP